ncbi:MAG TPA: DinB family protein [Gemmataceae bacterium]|nr:DinB family protein [Gemmataceae bacterium]
MTAKDAIKRVFDTNFNVLEKYVSDLSDADLLVRPVPRANHAAWQLGHLIAAEISLLSSVPGGPPLELPPGFAERHGKETAAVDPPKGFLSKAEYMSIFKKVREQTFAKLDRLSDADLDKPNTGRMAQFFPTLGDLFLLVAGHQMMHAGQFAVLRRKLGKPILI